MKIKRNFYYIACLGLALIGLGLRLYLSFSSVSNFPFAISWSESGRIFNAYQIYAPLISGENFTWPWLDPARSLLEGLVLLIPSSKIWMWRLWISILYLASTYFTSYLIVKRATTRLNNKSKAPRIILIIFGGLFLFQGPVYYHLLIGIIPVLWFYKHKHPWFILIIISISAIWTGLTRVNWFLMPTIIASVYYLLLESKGTKSIIQYFKWPALWGLINLIISGATYLISIRFASKPTFFDGTMDYGFFRSKLWPNTGFSTGLLLGILIITLPILFIILNHIRNNIKIMHWIRLVSLAIILFVLAGGSTLVSLRAGGGYDLHNYDSFILILFIIGISFGFNRFTPDEISPSNNPILLDLRVIFILFLIPILMMTKQIRPIFSYSTTSSNQAIQDLNNTIVNKTTDKPDSILFLDHRHLVIYHLISAKNIFNPYEKVELMEMAMAGNQEYLHQFWVDIENHRFDLIVSSTLFEVVKKPGEDPFWYENNVWSNNVVFPINRFYQPVYTNEDYDLVIYEPIH